MSLADTIIINQDNTKRIVDDFIRLAKKAEIGFIHLPEQKRILIFRKLVVASRFCQGLLKSIDDLRVYAGYEVVWADEKNSGKGEKSEDKKTASRGGC